MKKYFLLVLIFLLFCELFSAERVVVGEVFSESWNSYCEEVRAAFNNLDEEYDNFLPLIWSGDEYESPNYEERKAEYEITPCLFEMMNGEKPDIDIGGSVQDRLETTFNEFATIASPLEMEVFYESSDSLITVKADISLEEDLEDEYRIIYLITNNYNESYSSVIKAYYADSFSLNSAGDSGIYSHTFEMNSEWSLVNLRTAVLIQNINPTDTTSVEDYEFNMVPVLQAGFSEYPLTIPNPIENQVLIPNQTIDFDLTNYFYLYDEPAEMDLTVEAADTTIVETTLNDTILTITAKSNLGETLVTISGANTDYEAEDTFLVEVVEAGDFKVKILNLDESTNAVQLKNSIDSFYYRGDVEIENQLSDIVLNDRVDALFVLLGISPNNVDLSDSLSTKIVNFLEEGGNVYLEGSDVWTSENQTEAHAMFYISGTNNGLGDLYNIQGFGFLDSLNWVYEGENASIDHLEVLSDAFPLFKNQNLGYVCGVANEADNYKTIGISFQLEGLGGENHLNDAVSGIVDFFEIGGYQFLPPADLAINETTAVFTWTAPDHDEFIGTYVYLDGEQVGATLAEDWQFFNLEPGEDYVAGLKAIYNDGESELVDLEFNYEGNSTTEEINQTEFLGNYPNPFNPFAAGRSSTTFFQFYLETKAEVKLKIYNLKGQKINEYKREFSSGKHFLEWNGKDKFGINSASGVYFYRLDLGEKECSGKLLLVK